MTAFLVLCILILIGLDLRISFARWKKFGPECELNPLIRYAAKTEGLHGGAALLLVWNLAILALLVRWQIPLAMFLGTKIGLALLQIKSLEYK